MNDSNIVDIVARKKMRLAVLALELAQGFCFASWASRLPDIKEFFGVNNYLLYGAILIIMPIGKFLAVPIVGYLFPTIGNRRTVFMSILGYAFTLLLIGIVPNIYLLCLGILLFGVFWNMTDISLNTQAIEVDRLYDKSIIATFHAGWSFAAFMGALFGFLLINLDVSYHIHLVTFSILAVITILIAYKYLPQDKINEESELLDLESKSEQEVERKHISIGKRSFKLPESILIRLGLIWLIALIIENTIFEWSDIYFQSVTNAPKSLQIGFLVIMATIFLGRLLTTLLYRIWTKQTVLIVAGFLLFIGFTISALLVGMYADVHKQVAINALGFMLIGLGISCVVPTIHGLVGDKANTPVGTALTIMAAISFAGPLIAPALVGLVSQYLGGLKVAYLIIGLLGLLITALSASSKSLKDKPVKQ